uniref:Uncharacterized protein n=1 Tax=Anguilla anguilla TaxID=7936 RepID=A0A0E9RI57_ANGAN
MSTGFVDVMPHKFQLNPLSYNELFFILRNNRSLLTF